MPIDRFGRYIRGRLPLHEDTWTPVQNKKGSEMSDIDTQADSGAFRGILNELRDAFESDLVPHKNIALRKADNEIRKIRRIIEDLETVIAMELNVHNCLDETNKRIAEEIHTRIHGNDFT